MKLWKWGLVLLLLLALTACAPRTGSGGGGEGQTPAPSQPAASPPAGPIPTAPSDPADEPSPSADPLPQEPEDPIARQLENLTVEQKVGQLLVAGIEGYTPGADALTAVTDYQVGGIILFRRNVESVAQLLELNNALKALNAEHIPLFLCVDEEGGVVSRMPHELLDLPSAYEDGGDPFLRGRALGAQCAAFGFSMNFAPVMDIWSNPDNTVIGKRAFGSDGETVTPAANAAAHGLMTEGVIPVAKHFPGHGDTAVDSHVGLPVVDKTVEELWELELAPFRQAVANTDLSGVEACPIPAVMVGHILLTALDPERPATLSPAVVGGLLRERMGFEGVVVTDDLTMGAVSGTYSVGEAAVLAVEAGCDLLLVCHTTQNLTAARDALLEAVASGRISAERLNESVYRILKLKADFNLTNEQITEPVDVDALNEFLAAAQT